MGIIMSGDVNRVLPYLVNSILMKTIERNSDIQHFYGQNARCVAVITFILILKFRITMVISYYWDQVFLTSDYDDVTYRLSLYQFNLSN